MKLISRFEGDAAQKIIQRLAWATVGCVYFLIALGATVRVYDAGLGCLDWPLCNGQLYSSTTSSAILEQLHRYWASVVSVLLIALCLSIYAWGRKNRQLFVLAIMAPFLLALQIVLGGLTVLLKLEGAIITSHLATAEALFAVIITIAVMSGKPQTNREHPEKTQKFAKLAIVNALLVYGLLLSGSYVFNTGSSLACPGWPLCGTAPFWAVEYHLSDINMFHRYVATAIGLVTVWTIFSAWRRRKVAPGQAAVGIAGGIIFLAQAGVGALVVLLNKPVLMANLHLALATGVFACMVLLAVLAVRQWRIAPQTFDAEKQPLSEVEPAKEVSPLRQTIANYVNLIKPHVTVLLLGITVATMAIAKQSFPSLGLVLATLLGGAMAAGSANCLNCFIDRDIDQIMGRTQRRSLPSGKVQPQQALIFGIILGIASFVVFTAFVNLLSAALSFGAILFYVFVYTIGLKRTTAQNIVIGGAAGAVPVLVGWAAVTNTITLPAIWLFAIIFYWTPPHFWALALLIEKDYEKARVPMLPVLMGVRETRKQIFLYTLLLVAVTLVLFAIPHLMSYFYLFGALTLGGIMIYMAVRLMRDQSKNWARTLFWYSNCYLAAIFALMVVDRVIFVG
jgi:heme o synthase